MLCKRADRHGSSQDDKYRQSAGSQAAQDRTPRRCKHATAIVVVGFKPGRRGFESCTAHHILLAPLGEQAILLLLVQESFNDCPTGMTPNYIICNHPPVDAV